MGDQKLYGSVGRGLSTGLLPKTAEIQPPYKSLYNPTMIQPPCNPTTVFFLFQPSLSMQWNEWSPFPGYGPPMPTSTQQFGSNLHEFSLCFRTGNISVCNGYKNKFDKIISI